MTTASRKPYTVGLLTIVALGSIALSIFLIGSEQRLWQGRSPFRLHFTRTNGLQENAPVALDGVNVGRVSAMRFPPDPTARYVEVEIRVAKEVLPRIRRDTVARIQTFGLLGDKYIELSSGSLEKEALSVGDLISAVDPIDYEAIFGQSGDVVSNTIEVTALLRQLLADINDGQGLIGRLVRDRELGTQVSEDLGRAADQLEAAATGAAEITSAIRSGKGNLGALVNGEPRVATVLENLDVASREIRTFVQNLNTGDGALPRLVNDEAYADRTLGRLEDASSSIAEVAARVRSGQGTLGKLVYDDALHDSALAWFGGDETETGGFWRLLGRTLTFFAPPLPRKHAEATRPGGDEGTKAEE
jgi:phospholipid/cholesterol/gamma-HCH transport system substrate-binding protein